MHVRRTPAALLVLAAVAGGCGGAATRSGTADRADDARAVRAVVTRFGVATAARDYRAICRSLLVPSLVRQIERIGLPCEGALQRGLGRVRNPRLTVGSVRVHGAYASVATHSTADGQRPSDDLVELVRAGGRWYIATLASGEPSSSRPAHRRAPAASKVAGSRRVNRGRQLR